MICPKCNSKIPDNGDCPYCDNNTDTYNPFVSLGDLTEDDPKPNESDNKADTYNPFVSLGDLTEDCPKPNDGDTNDTFEPKTDLLTNGAVNSFVNSDTSRENKSFDLEKVDTKSAAKKKFQWKKWMTAVACCAVVALALLCVNWKTLIGSFDSHNDSGGSNVESSLDREQLSDSCDYILCSGVDTSGNKYELVANQTESALDYEITVGVIKNNEWLYPLSSDFPFLGEDGLFHVTVSAAGESGSSLSTPNIVRQNLYFIDSGAFLMECYTEAASWFSTIDHSLIIFSCDSLKSYTINCKEASLLYRYSEAEFSQGNVISYGRIYTDDGKILLYSELSYDWCTFDPKTLDVTTFAKNVEGIYPVSALSEGLIFASDRCFYNTKMQKVIDLSEYYIDVWYGGDIYFENGTCTFETKNSLGSLYEITIDKNGKVIDEVKQ